MAYRMDKLDLGRRNYNIIKRELKITINNKINKSVRTETIIKECDNYILVPFNYGVSKNEIIVDRNIDENSNLFKGTLREEQLEIYNQTIDTLKTKRSGIISANPGFGKTITAIKVACSIGGKILILAKNKLIVDQWVSSIKEFTDTSHQVLKPNIPIEENHTFYIINPTNIKKFPEIFFQDVDLLIMDEFHQLMGTNTLQNIFTITPFFLLGLSATPFRYDSYDKCIKLVFGKNIICNNILHREHNIYYEMTGVQIPSFYNRRTEKLDWNKVLDYQANMDERNEHICNVIADVSQKNRTILVLTKRVEHANKLSSILNRKGIPSEVLTGCKTTYNKDCKILIGTVSKLGVGFDNKNIDTLFLPADVEAYFYQILGRCMRTPNPKVVPCVFEFIDDFGPFIKHFQSRCKVYRKHGGKLIQI